MYGYDVFLFAGTIATLFWCFATLWLQKKFMLYTLIVGKKSALTVHIVLMSFVALQQLALTVYDIKSRWLFTSAWWPLGDLIFAASLFLLVNLLLESGPGIIIGTALFTHKKPHKGPLWSRFKQPIALSLGGTYVGLGLLTGHIAYIVVAAGFAIGLTLVGLATSRMVL